MAKNTIHVCAQNLHEVPRKITSPNLVLLVIIYYSPKSFGHTTKVTVSLNFPFTPD